MMSLKVDNLNVFYGQIQVTRNISFDLSRGEIVCIFGSNGHGKSTLLKSICGLVKASSGKITYEGTDITNCKVHEVVKQGIVYIPEDRNLFNGMTVIENLKLGAYLPKARRKEEENLHSVFNLFPCLRERKQQVVSTLSGGELRMLAVGRGFMTDADCLLIDEPSIGLSPLVKTETYNAIQKIKEVRNCTILLVEQDVKEAKRLADRAFLLKHGEFVFGGPKEALDEETVRRAFL
jgi:branched-chain amino acid transport system ATP-binding protein